jgi:glycogen debranching enzyme
MLTKKAAVAKPGATSSRAVLSPTQLDIKVGPPQLSIHQGHTVLVCDSDGQIVSPSQEGLYFRDTRVISRWALYADGEPWELLNSGATSSLTVRVYLTNRQIRSEAGVIPERTIGLVLSRYIDGGMREKFDLTNHGRHQVKFNLELVICCDFADIFEVKSGNVVRRGRVYTSWSPNHTRLSTNYHNGGFSRTLTVTARTNGPPAKNVNGRLAFEIELASGKSWHACLTYDLTGETQICKAPTKLSDEVAPTSAIYKLAQWQHEATQIYTSNDQVARLFRQATNDMAALRLPVGGQFVAAAGLP